MRCNYYFATEHTVGVALSPPLTNSDKTGTNTDTTHTNKGKGPNSSREVSSGRFTITITTSKAAVLLIYW